MHRTVQAPNANPGLPLSTATVVGDLVFLSGCIPVTAEGAVVDGGMRAQATQVFDNMRDALAAAGCDFANVVKVNAFVRGFDDFASYNEVYQQYFSAPFPARTTVQSDLHGFDLEVEAVACLPTSVTR